MFRAAARPLALLRIRATPSVGRFSRARVLFPNNVRFRPISFARHFSTNPDGVLDAEVTEVGPSPVVQESLIRETEQVLSKPEKHEFQVLSRFALFLSATLN
jgi:hypothetical protein